MSTAKLSTPDTPLLTWCEVASDVALGLDMTSGGVWAIQNSAGRYVFHTPSAVTVAIGGVEEARWDGRAGNNLVGDRSTVVVGSEVVSLDAPVLSIEAVKIGGLHGVVTRRHHVLGDVSETFLVDSSGVISRELTLVGDEGAPGIRIRWCDLIAPGVKVMPDATTMVFPGMAAAPGWRSRPIQRSLVEDLVDAGGVSATVPLLSDIGSSLVGVTDGTVGVWAGYVQSRFVSSVNVIHADGAYAPVHRVYSSARAEGGVSLSTGHQVWGVGDQSSEVGRRIRAHHDELYPSVIPQTPQNLTIYEVHVGNKFPDPFAPNAAEGPNPYPTVPDLIADLPRVVSLGFTAIQLMPHFPYPGYTIDDYLKPENQYGGSDELQALGVACRDAGLDLIVDFILHGPVDKDIRAYAPWAPAVSRYLVENPDWFMRDEKGRIRRTHTYSFDLAHPGVIDHMVSAMVRLVECGVTGFRVDAPLWNMFPHWGEGIDYPAGASTMGWVSIITELRRTLQASGKTCVLIGETAGFLAQKLFDLVYGYDEMGLTRTFVDGERPFLALGLYPDDVVTASDIRQWWREKVAILGPRGISATIRHLDSHDSYEWGGLSTWARDTFGDAFPALFASFSSLPGPWMHFAGAEEHCEDVVKDVLTRRSHPAIMWGELDLDATFCDHPDLMHHASLAGDHVSVVLANLSPHRLTTTVYADGGVVKRLGTPWVVSDFDGGPRGALSVTMEPWEYQFFQTPVGDGKEVVSS